MSEDDTTNFSDSYTHLPSDVTLRWLDSLALQDEQLDANASEGHQRKEPLDPDSDVDLPLAQSLAEDSGCPTTVQCSLEQSSSQGNDSRDANPCHAASSSSSATSQRAKKTQAQIALDPSQPLTAAGRLRVRVYVACHDCRSLKIRCDGAKPLCHNCHRRAPETLACTYDSLPRGRGQDKVPDTRRKLASGNQTADAHGANSTRGVCLLWHYENLLEREIQDPVSSFDPSTFNSSETEAYHKPARTQKAPEPDEEQDPGRELTPEPSVLLTRETWWDSLLRMYASEDIGQELQDISLTADQRFMYTQRIFVDIRALLHRSVYRASFLHLPRFFEVLIDPERRSSIQPGLILAMLALGTFVQSSNLRLGARGRKRAPKLVEQAHAALQASLSPRWVDIGLAQAAWFLASFEIQVHPEQSWEHNRSTFVLLDSLLSHTPHRSLLRTYRDRTALYFQLKLLAAARSIHSGSRRADYGLPGQREKWQNIRMKLIEACVEASVPLPSSALPPPISQAGLCAPLGPGSSQGSSSSAIALP
ncbi:hypothetical protein PYCCODRAFT_1425319 [Trametes coccinea BRFM310]|uniref:Zn(2)-C6 fungal-type domain-containing protein n=1 Tax=Trametes coccinea (strain BRFM310) TaxID=1353009 RepID=A0A1Y2IMZ9_TRAC3|nr:hypothetical protein PYCCODRAFT_1425319 [Trametes coccinea BRFM310]